MAVIIAAIQFFLFSPVAAGAHKENNMWKKKILEKYSARNSIEPNAPEKVCRRSFAEIDGTQQILLYRDDYT